MLIKMMLQITLWSDPGVMNKNELFFKEAS